MAYTRTQIDNLRTKIEKLLEGNDRVLPEITTLFDELTTAGSVCVSYNLTLDIEINNEATADMTEDEFVDALREELENALVIDATVEGSDLIRSVAYNTSEFMEIEDMNGLCLKTEDNKFGFAE